MRISKLMKSFVVLSVAAVLVACNTSTTEQTTAVTSAGGNGEDTRVQEAVLEVYIPAGKNTEYLKGATELYNKRYGTNITINAVDVAPTEGMVQKITPQLVAGETMPDLIFLQDSFAGAIFDKFEDAFYSSEDAGFITEHGDDFYGAKINMLGNIAPSKKVYGFPNDWGNASMFYNYAAFEEAGIDIEADVKTWDDFIEAGKKLKEKTGKNLLFMRDTGELDLVKYIAEQQSVSLLDKDGNLNLLDEGVINAYGVIQKLIDADLVSFGNSKDYTKIGQDCGAIFAGGWLASYQEADYPADSGNWRIGAMPNYSADTISVAPMAGGSSYYVLKKSNNPEAAIQLITFVLTDPEALDIYMSLKGLPANTIAYESEEANKGFEYYGDQKILQTLNEISKNSIEGYVFPYSSDLNNYIEQASYDIINNGTDVKEALTKQAKEFAAKYNITVISQ